MKESLQTLSRYYTYAPLLTMQDFKANYPTVKSRLRWKTSRCIALGTVKIAFEGLVQLRLLNF